MHIETEHVSKSIVIVHYHFVNWCKFQIQNSYSWWILKFMCLYTQHAIKQIYYTTRAVNIDLHNFCHLKQPCKSPIFKIYQKHLFLGYEKHKIWKQLYWLFSNKKTYYKMASIRKLYTFQNLFKNITLLPAVKFRNINLYQQTVLLKIIYDIWIEISFMDKQKFVISKKLHSDRYVFSITINLFL